MDNPSFFLLTYQSAYGQMSRVGWWSRLTGAEERRRSQERALLEQFLTLEQARLTHAATLDSRRAELETRKLELEIEHAETLQKARAEDLRLKAELAAAKREQTAKAREKRLTLQKVAQAQVAQQLSHECRVCKNPSDPSLSADEMNFHYQQHRAATSLFS